VKAQRPLYQLCVEAKDGEITVVAESPYEGGRDDMLKVMSSLVAYAVLGTCYFIRKNTEEIP
jgi:hypothetical protein